MAKARKIAARGMARNWQEVTLAMNDVDERRFHDSATLLDKDELDRLCNDAKSLHRQVRNQRGSSSN